MNEPWWEQPACIVCNYSRWLALVGIIIAISTIAYRTMTPPVSIERPQISLLWDNTNDLDLRIVLPDGGSVYFTQPAGQSGAVFSQDVNAQCTTAMQVPQEQVYWPNGDAPLGQYELWVDYRAQCASTSTTAFTVTVSFGEQLEMYAGQTNHMGESLLVGVFQRR